MSVTVITLPDALISLEEAKQHLRIEADDTNEDPLLTVLIGAAQGTIDGPDGWVGRAFGEQVLEWTSAGTGAAPTGPLPLPCPPVIAVESVTVRGVDGASIALPTDAYELRADGSVHASAGQGWPHSDYRPSTITVRYRAGYAEDALPVRVKQAILIMVAAMYENRQGAADIQNSATVHSLLSGLRVWRV